MAVELVVLSTVAYRGRVVTAPRLRALLVLLAGDLKNGCGVHRLVEGLWPDERPENPGKAVHVLVSRVRTQLGADLIASTPTGYRLALEQEQLDATAIRLNANAADKATRSGDHVEALACAEAGLRIWDGTGGGDSDPVAEFRKDHVPVWRSLNRAKALALGRLGRHAEAVGLLEELAGRAAS
ncbi:DNA-binding SARP family transcriptional activator [Kibdelosporangium banguiense]|uniref:DNA-binding SARP family transcriptional activator n=1 Tax=Kibdelosporangium banguiense TaxID=1365924 RepID=A0ABS4T6S1_9PSEU|nr:BTAD domain-containing putative transcriptional regulator [Kibdelosporangium banguiense]MBP2319971.1 DNA-binding SARP family transcriptional activator [Kibdelosporangium banguiense]